MFFHGVSRTGDAMTFWDPDWSEFSSKHGEWVQRQNLDSSAGDVLYGLPLTIVGHLARPLKFGRPILSPEDVAAETSLAKLCEKHRAIGVFIDRPIAFEPLLPPPPAPFLEELQWFAKRDDVGASQKALRQTKEIAARLKGYVGVLLTSTGFLLQREQLRQKWHKIPAKIRPGLPLARTMLDEAAPKSLGRFFREFDVFCERFQLTRMVTWDLPEPAGPLLDGTPKPARLLAGRAAQLAIPAHFTIRSKDSRDLRRAIANRQRIASLDAGLKANFSDARTMQTFGKIFEIEHFQRIICARYGAPPRPKGFMNRLNEALASHLQVGAAHFRDLYRRLSKLRSLART